jgi:hypothetical protein
MGKDTQEVLWFCCRCTYFWSWSLYYTCINCHHRRCSYCTYKRVGKPGNPSTQRAQETLRPALPTQRPTAPHLLTTRAQETVPQNRSDHQALSGPSTTSLHTNAGITSFGKLARPQTSVEVQDDRDGESLTVVFQIPEVVTAGHSHEARSDCDSTKIGCSSNNELLRLIIAPEAETFTPAKTVSSISSIPKTRPTEKWLRSQVRVVHSWTHSSTYSPQPTLLSDCKVNYDEPQAAARSPVPTTKTTSVKTDMTSGCGKAPIQNTVEKSPSNLYKQTRRKGLVALPSVQSFSSRVTDTNSEAGLEARLHADSDNDLDAAFPMISAVVPLADVHDVAGQEMSELLIQKLYRMLCFDPSGSFRSYVGSQYSLDPVASDKTDKAPTTNRKRRLEGNHDEDQNDGENNDRKSSRMKRSRVKSRILGGLLKEFACPFCKRNLDYGYQARCIGWSTSNIDTVLRVSGLFPTQQLFYQYARRHRTLLTRCQHHLWHHVNIEPQHLSEAKYDRVNEMKRDYNVSYPSQAEELWVAAYMEIFEIDHRNRHTVPNPCTSLSSLKTFLSTFRSTG